MPAKYVTSACSAAALTAALAIGSLRHWLSRNPGSIKPLFFPRPFPLLGKELVSAGNKNGSAPVWRLTFGLLEGTVLGLDLGLGEHVKVYLPAGLLGGKPRSYSPTSDPLQKGSFDLTVKEYNDGHFSKYLAGLQTGDQVLMSRGWPFPAPFMMQRIPGTHVGLIAMGVGITEAVWVAREELRKSDTTHVQLLYANKFFEDRIMLGELAFLQKEYPDRFHFQDLVSREEHPKAWFGRVSTQVLQRYFAWDTHHSDVRFLCVGTKPMKKDVHAMLEEMGYPQHSHALLVKKKPPRPDWGQARL